MAITGSKKPTPPAPPAPKTPTKKPHERINEIQDLITQSWQKHQLPETTSTNQIVWMAQSFASATHWLDGDIWTWQPPHGYTTRLATATRWLQQHQHAHTGELKTIRDQIIRVLNETWPALHQICADPEANTPGQPLQFARLPTIWVPDTEFGPYNPNEKTPALPIWDNTPCGKTAEQWDVYCTLLGFLNLRLELDVLDIFESELPF